MKKRGWIDIGLISALGLFLQTGRFAVRHGRAVLCADSVQYLDNARALSAPGLTPHFGYRKPGYSLFLAALGLDGALVWPIVAVNHALIALIPVAAYLLARQLCRNLGAAPPAPRDALNSHSLDPPRAGSRRDTTTEGPRLNPDRGGAGNSETGFMTGAEDDRRSAPERVVASARRAARSAARFVGWLAASGALMKSSTFLWTDRVMSESLYAGLLCVGAWLGVRALEPPIRPSRFLGGGIALGAAWLTRSIAAAVIAAMAIPLVVMILRGWSVTRMSFRRGAAGASLGGGGAEAWRRIVAVRALAALAAPIAAAVLLECGLNFQGDGVFRPCASTSGSMMMLRTRFIQGTPLPDAPAVRRALALLPERSAADAYLVNKLDGWVARHRALVEHGMNDWEFDALMKEAALEGLRAAPGEFLSSFARLFIGHLARRPVSPSSSPVPPERRRPPIRHPRDTPATWDERHWYTYWALPQRSPDDAHDFVTRLHRQAEEKASCTRSGVWAWARHAVMKLQSALDSSPAGLEAFKAAAGLSFWPGLILLGVGAFLGLGRGAGLFLLGAYLLEAGAIGAVAATYESLPRFQDVWLGVDVVVAWVPLGLTASMITHAAARRLKTRRIRRNAPRLEPSGTP